jgi:superfamily II DNA or RNA helicase
MPCTVQFADDRMRVHFGSFGIDEYQTFLKCKRLPECDVEFDDATETYTITAPARFAEMLGQKAPVSRRKRLPWNPALYDDQQYLCQTSLDAKRFAVWSGCGNGKTLIGLEWCRQVAHSTRGRALIVTLNQIVPEWLNECQKFYGDDLKLFVIESRAKLREWCAGKVKGWKTGIAIVNYEKFNPDADGQLVSECQQLAGVCLDESSRLKTGGGKQKWAIIKSFKGVEYKLSLTATPAPNDVMEFASQASFLEKLRTEGEILWTFFTRNPVTTEWEVKPHARTAFYEFLSSWSIYINNPKRFGWRLDQPEIPAPTYHTVTIKPTSEQLQAARKYTAGNDGQMTLFAATSPSAIQRTKLSQIAKGFVYGRDADGKQRATAIPTEKTRAVVDLVTTEVHVCGAQVIVWTEFDAESLLIANALHGVRGVETLTGKVSKDERPAMIDRFRSGDTRVLITRAKLIGFGINLQCASAMVFSGWSDSFESLYQAIRRSFRHGQTESVRVYFPMVDQLETDTFENIQRKEREFNRSIEEMESRYVLLMTTKQKKPTTLGM